MAVICLLNYHLACPARIGPGMHTHLQSSQYAPILPVSQLRANLRSLQQSPPPKVIATKEIEEHGHWV